MADFHRRDSFLRSTDTFEGFLDINTLPKIPKSVDDDIYIIDAKYHERPDLLAYDRYGSSRLWWVFALRNPDLLVDPLEDFTSGLSIFLPTKETVDRVTG